MCLTYVYLRVSYGLNKFFCAAAPSTNPFVAAGMVQETISTNPFQTNGRAPAAGKTWPRSDQHALYVSVHLRNEQMKHATPTLVSLYVH